MTFPSGSATNATQAVTVPIVQDSADEESETFSLAISVVTGGAVGSLPSTTLTIVDDDPAPTLSITDVTQSEGNSGTANAVFTVSLSAAGGKIVQVSYASSNGSAVAGTDYGAVAGTLTFPPGTQALTIAVPVYGEGSFEPTETFLVTLAVPVNATIADAQGVGTIVNDDTPRRTWGDMYSPVDGAADGALFTPGTGAWTFADSSTGAFQTFPAFGEPTDIPVPADYDGDGRTDCAFYRPSSGAWIVAPSCQRP